MTVASFGEGESLLAGNSPQIPGEKQIVAAAAAAAAAASCSPPVVNVETRTWQILVRTLTGRSVALKCQTHSVVIAWIVFLQKELGFRLGSFYVPSWVTVVVAVWGILGVCMLLDCRGTCSSALGHHSQPGSVFSKSLCVVSQTFSGSVSADASLQPLSGANQCPFLTAMFHPVLEGAVHFSEASFCLPVQVLVGFVAVCVVHPALDGVVQISEVSFCLPVRALLFTPVGDDPPPCAGGSHARACLRGAPLPPCAGRRSLNGGGR